MEYIYCAMLLHSAGKKITEASVAAVLKAADIDVNDAKLKSMIASLEGVNIQEAIEKSAVAAAPQAPAAAAPAGKKEENKEDDKKGEEEAASGLASLFG